MNGKRKLFGLVAILSLLLFCVTGCSKGLQATIVGVCDCIAYQPDETALPSNHEFHREGVAKEESITFEGETFTGKYSHSEMNMSAGWDVDIYEIDGRETFGIDVNTGEWQRIYFDTDYDKKRTKKTKEELKKVACDIAGKYINLSEYTIEQSDSRFVEFQKYLEGVQTQDEFSVLMHEDGEVIQIRRCCNGKYPADISGYPENIQNRVRLLVSEEAKKKIIQTAMDAYGGKTEVKEKEIDSDITRWVLLEDGTLGILYDVELQWQTPVEGEEYVDVWHAAYTILLK